MKNWYLKEKDKSGVSQLKPHLSPFLDGSSPCKEFRMGTHHGNNSFKDQHPGVLEELARHLVRLRDKGCIITMSSVQDDLRDIIALMCPKKFAVNSLSTSFYRNVCNKWLGLWFRRATTASQNIPMD
jgi:hypothetical protein